MRGLPPPTTTWEIEAARHQEVVASEFHPDRGSRAEDRPRPGARAAILARLASWTSAAGQGANAPSGRPNHGAACPPATVRAVKPGA